MGQERTFKWFSRFLNVAADVASWSKDPNRKVGALLVSLDHRELAWGFNGFPQGIADDHRLQDNQLKNDLMIHAERNAINNARRNLGGYSLYVTAFPCHMCALDIIQAKIRRVIVAEPAVGPDSKWFHSHRLALTLFREAEVEVWVSNCDGTNYHSVGYHREDGTEDADTNS